MPQDSSPCYASWCLPTDGCPFGGRHVADQRSWRSAISIFAVNRISSGLIAATAILMVGALASACGTTPIAATVNGDTVTVASLNTELQSFSGTEAGQCLLELQNPQALTVSGEGSGGSGTYQTNFAGAVLSNSVGNLVAAQFAATRHIRLSGSDLATSQSSYTSSLSGEITAMVQQASAAGVLSRCQRSDGRPYTGQTLLAALPESLRSIELANQAVDNRLLALGSDQSDAAVKQYYDAHRDLFTIDCVSDIATATQAEADQVVIDLNGGAAFDALATKVSIDTQTASTGGQLGCNFTEARVLQALQLSSVTVGQPVTPIQTANGSWVIYEVTSQKVEPLSSAASLVRQQLLHTAANIKRVTTELLAFARHSSIAVNAQYGTWTGVKITAPPTPDPRYLQPSPLTAPAKTSGAVPGSAGAGAGAGGAGAGAGGAATAGTAAG